MITHKINKEVMDDIADSVYSLNVFQFHDLCSQILGYNEYYNAIGSEEKLHQVCHLLIEHLYEKRMK